MKTKAAYTISLSDWEIESLAFCADRGYFPTETYDGLTLTDGEPEEGEPGYSFKGERVWELQEHAAWPLSNLANDDPDAFLACLGDKTLEKVINLWNSIV
tara:strand:- start:412 stop:711 length:300 start_codon:yes stop_codon:yes gene_type:complete